MRSPQSTRAGSRFFAALLVASFAIVAHASSASAPLRVVVLGDSLASGYGLDPEQAFPALLQSKAESSNLPVEIVNAGVSGDTSAGGLRRINWLLREPVDVLVIELGGNDGLRGIQVETTEQNLQGIIDRTRRRYRGAAIVLAGMKMPENMGVEYTTKFAAIFPRLAEKNGAFLIPFLLEGVAGDPNLNQEDRIHPTAEGQRIVAENVWRILGPILEARTRAVSTAPDSVSSSATGTSATK